MKVLLAIDEDPSSKEAVSEVARRKWEEATTFRALHAVGKFVHAGEGKEGEDG